MSAPRWWRSWGEQIADARQEGVLFSLHLKATMMKVSDPIIFGHACARSSPTCSRSTAPRSSASASTEQRPRRPAGQDRLPARGRDAPRSRPTSQAAYAKPPGVAMVDSDKGITNLHVPSDVIVDASMPAMIRTSGQMWGPTASCRTPRRDPRQLLRRHLPGGHRRLPRANGAFDPATMGSVPNVGLMAQKAEEYGSPRQDLRDQGDGHRAVVDAPAPCCSSTRWSRRHLARLPGEGRPDARLGEAGRDAARAPPARRPSSGWTPRAPTTRSSSPRSNAYLKTTTPRAWRSAS
jgi:monomeric type NADP-dependent isocitrate dehydrogenase